MCSFQPIEYRVTEGVNTFVDLTVMTTNALRVGSSCVVTVEPITALAGRSCG